MILTSRDERAIKFLGFNIKLSLRKNKAKVKSNRIKRINKYKKKSFSLLKERKGDDARISQAYFNSIKHDFLNYLQNIYEKLN